MALKESSSARRDEELDRDLAAYSAAASAVLELEASRAKRPNNRRLVVYSAAVAGASLAGAESVEAAIQWTPVNWTMQSSDRPIDLDGGGNDVKLEHTVFAWGRYARVSEVVGVGATTDSVATDGAGRAFRFANGDTIDGGDTWDIHNGSLFMYYTGGTPTRGNFRDGQVGYVGVRFNSGAGMKYGWIHIDSVANDFTSYHVSGYAYQDDGSSIKAGEGVVPEPSTIALALLASGAAGVMVSRRKKILKGRSGS